MAEIKNVNEKEKETTTVVQKMEEEINVLRNENTELHKEIAEMRAVNQKIALALNEANIIKNALITQIRLITPNTVQNN